MTPEELKDAREKLDLTQDGLGKKLDRCKRFVLYRESGAVPIDSMLKYAVKWLLHCAGFKIKKD